MRRRDAVIGFTSPNRDVHWRPGPAAAGHGGQRRAAAIRYHGGIPARKRRFPAVPDAFPARISPSRALPMSIEAPNRVPIETDERTEPLGAERRSGRLKKLEAQLRGEVGRAIAD